MLSRRSFIAISLSAISTHAIAQAGGQDAVAVVKSFYSNRAPGWEKRPFSKKLMARYKAAVKKSHELNEPVSGLDFDPATGSQDSDDGLAQRLTFKPSAAGSPDKTIVSVTMRVFKSGPETTVIFELVREGKAWKVDDIFSPDPKDGWRWSTMLDAGAQGQ